MQAPEALAAESGCQQFLSPPVPLARIEDFVETSIVLKKDKNGLGLGIVGGSNTFFETVCVSELDPGGAASRDGRLQLGDILLEVNDVSLRTCTQLQAARALRQASSPVKLRVLRENPEVLFVTDEDPCRFVTIVLKKTIVTESLGLSLMGSRRTEGVFVTWVKPGSLASRNGKILQGDRILEINGQDVRKKSQADVSKLLRDLEGEVVIVFGRVPNKAMSIQEWSRQKAAALNSDVSPDRTTAVRSRAFTWSYASPATSTPSMRSSSDKQNKSAVDDLADEDHETRMLIEFPMRPRINTNVLHASKTPSERRPLFKLIRMSFKRSAAHENNPELLRGNPDGSPPPGILKPGEPSSSSTFALSSGTAPKHVTAAAAAGGVDLDLESSTPTTSESEFELVEIGTGRCASVGKRFGRNVSPRSRMCLEGNTGNV